MILKDENGIEYEIDFEKAQEMKLIKRYIKQLWYPALDENYYYLTETLLIKENKNTNRDLNKIRLSHQNAFKNISDAKRAAEFLRGDMSKAMLKFAIENNCLATLNDIKNEDVNKYEITFQIEKNKYVVTPSNSFVGTTPLFTDKEIAKELAAIFNILKQGYIDENNYKEETIKLDEDFLEYDE